MERFAVEGPRTQYITRSGFKPRPLSADSSTQTTGIHKNLLNKILTTPNSGKKPHESASHNRLLVHFFFCWMDGWMLDGHLIQWLKWELVRVMITLTNATTWCLPNSNLGENVEWKAQTCIRKRLDLKRFSVSLREVISSLVGGRYRLSL